MVVAWTLALYEYGQTGMSALSLLVPTGLTEIDKEVLAATRGAARNGDVLVTLLHVVSEEQGAACEEARRALLALERRYLSRKIESRVSVRCGEPLAEIPAEAQRIQADAILVSRSAALDLIGPFVGVMHARSLMHGRARSASKGRAAE